jgi:hypothetical protein
MLSVDGHAPVLCPQARGPRHAVLVPPDAHHAALEIKVPATALLDEPLIPRARGAGPDDELVWRARFRDDDGRVWRASAGRAGDLAAAWVPAKPSTGPVAALQSLHPLSIDLRVELTDGRAAGRSVTRRLMDEGVRMRRWREGLSATLHLPAGERATATLLVDATAGAEEAMVAALAAPLLASRGLLVLAVAPARGGGAPERMLATARERLAAVPGAAPDVHVLRALAPSAPPEPGAAVSLPPGVGAREPDHRTATAARAASWDALLARLGARPRGGGPGEPG